MAFPFLDALGLNDRIRRITDKKRSCHDYLKRILLIKFRIWFTRHIWNRLLAQAWKAERWVILCKKCAKKDQHFFAFVTLFQARGLSPFLSSGLQVKRYSRKKRVFLKQTWLFVVSALREKLSFLIAVLCGCPSYTLCIKQPRMQWGF